MNTLTCTWKDADPRRGLATPPLTAPLVSVPQRDLPEQQHHADTETRLPRPAQPGADVSDLFPVWGGSGLFLQTTHSGLSVQYTAESQQSAGGRTRSLH